MALPLFEYHSISREMAITIKPEAGAAKHIDHRIKSFFTFDKIRAMQILESIQYGFGYLIVGFLGGTILDYSFPVFNEEQSVHFVLIEVILQTLALAVLVFYLRKLVKIAPFFFYIHPSGKKYQPYLTSEYDGEVMIGIALLGAQFNLIKKMDFLSRKLYKWIFNEERKIVHSI